MEIKYSKHAVERMLQRKISTQDVDLILAEPDGEIRQSKDKFIFYKSIKGRKDNAVAAVTVLKKKREFEIITVLINFKVKS